MAECGWLDAAAAADAADAASGGYCDCYECLRSEPSSQLPTETETKLIDQPVVSVSHLS